MKLRNSVMAVLALAVAAAGGAAIAGSTGPERGPTAHGVAPDLAGVEQADRRVRALCPIVDSSEREGTRLPLDGVDDV